MVGLVVCVCVSHVSPQLTDQCLIAQIADPWLDFNHITKSGLGVIQSAITMQSHYNSYYKGLCVEEVDLSL